MSICLCLVCRVMRGIIPVDITRSSYSKLLSVYSECNSIDHPEELAERIWNTKILWLICMHPDDIQKVCGMRLSIISAPFQLFSPMYSPDVSSCILPT